MKWRITFLILLALSIVAAVTVAANATEKKSFTIEDSLSVRSVGSPIWSPNGKWIAFTVTEWNKKNNGRDTHIYLVASAGGQLIKLTNGESDESNPQWSPDSNRIAFLANRGGGQQVWMISINVPETEKLAAEKLTNEENEISDFSWSPDGKSLAFTTRDTPADKVERDRRRKERFDVIVVDSNFAYTHLWVMDVATKEKKRLTEGEYIVLNPQWSPDSKRLSFHTTHNFPQESSYKDGQVNRNADIFVVSISEAKPRLLTTEPTGYEYDAIWSPDGKQIAYRSRKGAATSCRDKNRVDDN